MVDAFDLDTANAPAALLSRCCLQLESFSLGPAVPASDAGDSKRGGGASGSRTGAGASAAGSALGGWGLLRFGDAAAYDPSTGVMQEGFR